MSWGGAGQCYFTCRPRRCNKFVATLSGRDCGAYELEDAEFDKWQDETLPQPLQGRALVAADGVLVPIEVAGLALKMLALEEAERSGASLP